MDDKDESDIIRACESCGTPIDINKGSLNRHGWGCSYCGHFNSGTWAGEAGHEYLRLPKFAEVSGSGIVTKCNFCNETINTGDAVHYILGGVEHYACYRPRVPVVLAVAAAPSSE